MMAFREIAQGISSERRDQMCSEIISKQDTPSKSCIQVSRSAIKSTCVESNLHLETQSSSRSINSVSLSSQKSNSQLAKIADDWSKQAQCGQNETSYESEAESLYQEECEEEDQDESEKKQSNINNQQMQQQQQQQHRSRGNNQASQVGTVQGTLTQEDPPSLRQRNYQISRPTEAVRNLVILPLEFGDEDDVNIYQYNQPQEEEQINESDLEQGILHTEEQLYLHKLRMMSAGLFSSSNMFMDIFAGNNNNNNNANQPPQQNNANIPDNNINEGDDEEDGNDEDDEDYEDDSKNNGNNRDDSNRNPHQADFPFFHKANKVNEQSGQKKSSRSKRFPKRQNNKKKQNSKHQQKDNNNLQGQQARKPKLLTILQRLSRKHFTMESEIEEQPLQEELEIEESQEEEKQNIPDNLPLVSNQAPSQHRSELQIALDRIFSQTDSRSFQLESGQTLPQHILSPDGFVIYRIPDEDDNDSNQEDSILLRICLEELPVKLELMQADQGYLSTSESSATRMFLLDIFYEQINILPLTSAQIQILPAVISLVERMRNVFINSYLIMIINKPGEVWRHFGVLSKLLEQREKSRKNEKCVKPKNKVQGEAEEKGKISEEKSASQGNGKGETNKSGHKDVSRKQTGDNNKKEKEQKNTQEQNVIVIDEESNEIFFESGNDVSDNDKILVEKDKQDSRKIKGNQGHGGDGSDDSDDDDDDDDGEDDFEEESSKISKDETDKEQLSESGEVQVSPNRSTYQRQPISEESSPSSVKPHVPAAESQPQSILLDAPTTQNPAVNNTSDKLFSSSLAKNYLQFDCQQYTQNRFFSDPINVHLFHYLKPQFEKLDISNKRFYLARFRWQLYKILKQLPKSDQCNLPICTAEQKNIQKEIDLKLRVAYEKLKEADQFLRSYCRCSEVKKILKRLIEIKVRKQIGLQSEAKKILITMKSLKQRPSVLFNLVFKSGRLEEFIEPHKKIVQMIEQHSVFSFPEMRELLK